MINCRLSLQGEDFSQAIDNCEVFLFDVPRRAGGVPNREVFSDADNQQSVIKAASLKN